MVELEETKTREEELIDEADESVSTSQKYNFNLPPKEKKPKTTRSMKKIIKKESDKIRKQLIEELEGTPKK